MQIAPALTSPRDFRPQYRQNVPAGTDGVAIAANAANTGGAFAVAGGVPASARLPRRASPAPSTTSVSPPAGRALPTRSPAAPERRAARVTTRPPASSLRGPMSRCGRRIWRHRYGDHRQSGGGRQLWRQAGRDSSLFQTVQDMVSALHAARHGQQTTLALQAMENVLANLGDAQTCVLTAQATLGTRLAEIQSVQAQTRRWAAMPAQKCPTCNRPTCRKCWPTIAKASQRCRRRSLRSPRCRG